MALKKEFCKRGHLMAETRRHSGRGVTKCGECANLSARKRRAANPEKSREATRKYQQAHLRTPESRERRRAQDRARYARNLGRPVRTEPKFGAYRVDRKAYHLRWLLETRYGITIEQYNELVEVQGGRCAICNKLPKGTNHTTRRLAVDHDHATSTVRGLLCGPCNTTIGMIEDSPGLLDRMRRYLGRHAQLRLVEKL